MTKEEQWNTRFLQLLCYITERRTLATSVHPVVPADKRTPRDHQKVASNGWDYTENSQTTE